jgi:hypothetical protein
VFVGGLDEVSPGSGCISVGDNAESCGDRTLAAGASVTVSVPVTMAASDATHAIGHGGLTDMASYLQVRGQQPEGDREDRTG